MISAKECVIIGDSTAEPVRSPTTLERILIMKKILAIILCAGMFAAVAAGCGGSKQSEVATNDEAYKATYTLKKNVNDYKDDLNGLCEYFGALGYINPIEKNKGLTYSDMKGELIGAKVDTGKRFLAKHTKDTVIELYEYDLKNLNATADEVRASVQKDGTFVNLIGETVKNVYISDNGKYLMIYTDSTISGDTKETDANYKAREEVVKKFKAFHK